MLHLVLIFFLENFGLRVDIIEHDIFGNKFIVKLCSIFLNLFQKKCQFLFQQLETYYGNNIQF